jgi:hypothetical protein
MFLAPLVVGFGVAVFGFTSIGHQGFGVFEWSIAVLAVLMAGAIIGTLLNLAVLVPVYWALSRLHSKRVGRETRDNHHP